MIDKTPKQIGRSTTIWEIFKRTAIVLILSVSLYILYLFLVFSDRQAENTAAIRESQIEGTPLGKKLQRSSDLLIDCVTPEGTCYKESQDRTGSAVASIGEVSLLAAFCADKEGAQTYLEIKNCIEDALKEKQ